MPRKSSITSVTSITSTASSGRRPRSRRSSMQRRRSSCDSLTLSSNGLGNDNLSSGMLGVSISNISASLQDDELENEEEDLDRSISTDLLYIYTLPLLLFKTVAK